MSSDQADKSGFSLSVGVLVVLGVAALAILTLPIFTCDVCEDLWKSIKTNHGPDPSIYTCPCCGSSGRQSLLHRRLPMHRACKEKFQYDFRGL